MRIRKANSAGWDGATERWLAFLAIVAAPLFSFADERIFFTAAESPQELFEGKPAPNEPDAFVPPSPDAEAVADDPVTPLPDPPTPPAKPAPPVFPGAKTLPPTGPWKILYFENDFSYALQPDHEHLIGEELKFLRSDLYDASFTLATGGEIRHRYMNEDNRLRPGGPVHTDYNLWRWRHYIDAHWCDFRVYAEMIDADSFGSTAPDQAIDVNRWDLLNLFVDWTFLRDDLGAHTVRYGRQELLFGRQRLVSPLDWANTRRNFQGVRYMLKGDDYRLDAFATHPVNSATGFQPVAVYDSRFDQPNDNVWFSGTYFTYTGLKDTVIDAYWLYLDTGSIQNPAQPDGTRHLLGSRFARLIPVADGARVWDVDTEGGFQLGRDNGECVLAGFYTYIVGHTWKAFPFSPRLSHLFYYGSGDQIANSGHNNTFNTLFPLGHAYWAVSDNLAGQNLYDYAIQADVKPTKKTALTTAFHWFSLASNGDRLYNVAGAPVGAPGNGRDVGQALDLYGYYSHNANFDIQAGYSWFWYGSYVEAVSPRGDATQFYIQTSFRY